MSSSNFLKLHDHFFELGEIIGNRRKLESYNGSCIRLQSANLFLSFCFWKSSGSILSFGSSVCGFLGKKGWGGNFLYVLVLIIICCVISPGSVE